MFVTGIVFAVLPLFWVITAPLWASLSSKIGPRWLMIFGIWSISMCLLAFSFLEPIQTRGLFLAAAIAIRALQGAASASAATGGYVLVASVYPLSLGEVIGGTS